MVSGKSQVKVMKVERVNNGGQECVRNSSMAKVCLEKDHFQPMNGESGREVKRNVFSLTLRIGRST